MGQTRIETRLLSTLLLTIFATAVLFPWIFQPFLDAAWRYLKGNALFRASVFETVWTVFCYAATEPFVTYIFIKCPELRIPSSKSTVREADNVKSSGFAKRRKQPRGMKRPSRRLPEALTYVVPLLLLDLLMIKKYSGVSLEEKLISGNYDISALSGHSGHFLMPSLHNFTLSSPLQTVRALPQQAPSSRRVMLELSASLIIYDALFFLFHLSLHLLPGLRRLHAPHHQHQELHPQITNELSIVERIGLVLLANFSLNIIGSHVLTRTLFVPLFVWLLVEIHSGMDTWWSYDKLLPPGWAGGARKHKLHHEFGFEGGGVEPFFTWCDRLYHWSCQRFYGAPYTGRGNS